MTPCFWCMSWHDNLFNVIITYYILLCFLYLANVQCMNDHAWQYLNWHLPILHQKLLWVCKPCCSIHFYLPHSSETWRIENSMEIPIVEARTISECQDNNNLSSALINSAVLRCDGHGVTVNMPWRTNFICVDCQTWFLGITCKNTIYFACFFVQYYY